MLLCAVVVGALLFVPVVKKDYFSCAICGMQHRETSFAGFRFAAADEETDCSNWYRKNVEPRHEHLWIRATWSEAYGLCGVPRIGSNFAHRADGPIIRFGSQERMLIYQHCPDPELARAAFVRLSRWEAHTTEKREKQREIELNLAEWVESSFQGPWTIETQ